VNAFANRQKPNYVDRPLTPRDRPPDFDEQAGSIVEESKAWRLLVNLFDCNARLCRIVATGGRDATNNCKVGSCVSVTFQFLRFENRNRSFEFRRSLRLLLPKAMLIIADPSD